LDFESSTICEGNFDDFCIAYYENILTLKKAHELLAFAASDSTYSNKLNQFGKIKLKPQENIVFSNKRILYHKTIYSNFISTHIVRFGTVAASIAFIITVFLLVNEQINRKLEANVIQTSPKKSENIKVASTLQKDRTFIKKQVPSKISAATAKKEIVDTAVFSPGKLNREEQSLVLLATPQIKPLKAPVKDNTIIISEQQHQEIAQVTETQEEDNSKLNTAVESTFEKIKKEVVNFDSFKDKKGNFSLVKLVKAGVTGFSKMTESNMAVTEKTDSTGKITAYSFDSDIIKFQKNVRN
jgi:hypothetical protein